MAPALVGESAALGAGYSDLRVEVLGSLGELLHLHDELAASSGAGVAGQTWGTLIF